MVKRKPIHLVFTSTIVDARHQMLESRPKSYTQEIGTETKLKETFPNVHTCRFYTMSLIKTNTQIQTHTHTLTIWAISDKSI